MKIRLKHFVLYWLPPFLWAMVIFTFSSSPTAKVGDSYWFDFVVKKTVHVIEYGIFAILLYRGFINSGITNKKAMFLAIFFCFFYGATDEYHQSFTPRREPALRDVVFDTIGATLAMLGLWKLLPKMPKKLKSLAEKLDLN
jgi:VanZ family protein